MPATKGKRIAPPSSISRWEELFGCPAPQRLPSLVDQAISWREQALLHGDISAAVAHDLQLAAEHALQRRGVTGPLSTSISTADASAFAPLESTMCEAATSASALGTVPAKTLSGASPPQPRRKRAPALPPASSQLLPGSQLVKAHGGRNHVVAVEGGGFRYEGELFSSLSAVAKHITGTHWNGLLFFGLRKRRSYPPKPRRHG